jgi:uroporphyrinogen decarboxylase
MNPRERVLAAIHHEGVDRIPSDLWATPEVLDQLYRHFDVPGLADLYDRLGIDGIVRIEPLYQGPELVSNDDYVEDYWGVGYRKQQVQSAEYLEFADHPLAEAEDPADVEAYTWPEIDWFDFGALKGAAEGASGRALMCGYTAIFHLHNKLRGLETSLMDPLLRPELTRLLISKIEAFLKQYHRRCFETLRGRVDLTEVTDDWGTQTGLLSSPEIFDEFYREPMLRAVDLAKSYGVGVFHHDDGDIRGLLPRLVGLGIDVLNPIQWRCGDWDLDELKAKFGRRICFHGGVDNQRTLPFGSVEDVDREVEWLVSTLGRDRTGFILAPCHNLQPGTPLENILQLYESARFHGGAPRRRWWSRIFS